MQSRNKIVVASAGTGKSSRLATHALGAGPGKTLLLTYTRQNHRELRHKLSMNSRVIPDHIETNTWLTFLLHELARPFQQFLYRQRISNIVQISGRSPNRAKKSDIAAYYFASPGEIYVDKLAEFACQCNSVSSGAVIERLEKIYKRILIDEVQDLAGWDLELLELFLKSKIEVTLTGDPRQTTYQTNHSPKNSQYSGPKIMNKFEEWVAAGLCIMEAMTKSHRCRQEICDLANLLYPELALMDSNNPRTSSHDGVFILRSADVAQYMQEHNPTVLRYDMRSDCFGLPAINFGDSKGLTFERVLIFPNGPLKKVISSNRFEDICKSPAKYYVAITRARQSVAFVFDGAHNLSNAKLYARTESDLEKFFETSL